MLNTIEKIETFLPELERMCKAIQAARTRLIGAITIRDGAPGQPHLVTAAQLKEEMEGVIDLSIPLTVEVTSGKNWLEQE
jgi:hypothetical protein